MSRPLSLSRVVRRPDMRTVKPGEITRRASKRLGFSLAAGIFLVCLFLSACSSPFGTVATPTPTSSTQSLSKIGWCAKPLMVFRDEGAAASPTATATITATTSATSTPTGTSATSTPTGTSTTSVSGTLTPGPGTPQTVTDWSLVKANLGFTVYLPTSLPNDSCLVSAQATIHDPIFGGSFTIGYLLPDHTSLSFSEAPLKSQNTTFQCNTTTNATTPTTGGTTGKATPGSTPATASSQLCSGAKSTTNIVLSGPGTTDHLQQVFSALQPDINWIPVS